MTARQCPVRTVAGLAGALGMLAACVSALLFGVSGTVVSAASYHNEQAFDQLALDGTETSSRSRDVTVELLQRFEPWLDKDPRFVEEAARARYRHQARHGAGLPQHAAHSQILAGYRQAVTARPTWPFAWTGFAAVKVAHGEIDDEFLHALLRGQELGPWEPAVQRMTAELSLVLWSSLGPYAHNQLSANFRRMSFRQPAELQELAELYAAGDLLCNAVPPGEGDPRVAQCGSPQGSRHP